ncbi:MAG: hypothetical protein K5888_02845 [Lachnospiraceae bacterium]|nr:hypothetical protein [Lachnospiraceae bacterium]
MSNDLHQLVFVFKDGDLSNLKDYSHGTVFYIDVIWCYLMMVSSFFLCLYKSFKRIRKRHFLIAVVVITAHQVLHTVLFINPSDKLRIFGIYPFTLPMISNMAFIIFWEMCIMFGTIPSNIDYEDIFEISGISAKLTDEDKNTISSSCIQDPLTDEIRYSADEDINIGNTKIHSRKIPGGYIYWEEDVSQINEINEQLRETAERLSEENALLMEEARIREESERFNAVNRIYDDIAGRLKTKLKTINDILQDNGDRDENAFKQKLIRACVMGAYVKRYSNMTLMSKPLRTKKRRA